jgi:hypothetical protein
MTPGPTSDERTTMPSGSCWHGRAIAAVLGAVLIACTAGCAPSPGEVPTANIVPVQGAPEEASPSTAQGSEPPPPVQILVEERVQVGDS